MVAGGLVLGWLQVSSGQDVWVPALMVLGGAVMLAWRLAEGWMSQRTWRRHKLLREHIRGHLDVEAFHAEADHGRNRLPWNLLHQWKASDDLLLIYKAPRLFFILPKHWFSSLESWQQAKDLVSTRLPSRYRLQRKKFLWLAAGWILFSVLVAVNLFAD